jgi:hypothetical protein
MTPHVERDVDEPVIERAHATTLERDAGEGVGARFDAPVIS